MASFGSARAFFRDPVGYVAANGDEDGSPLELAAPGARFLVVRRPETVWQVLTRESDAYRQGRWKKRASRYVGPALNTLRGEEHRARRLLLQPALDRRRVAGFSEAAESLARDTVAAWPNGEALDLRSLLDPLSLRIASHVLLGHDPGADAPRLAAALRTVMESMPRLLPPLPGTGRSVALAEAEAFARAVVEERRAGDGTLVDLLCAADLPSRTVQGEIVAFLLAAADEPPSALSAIWYLLDGAPDVDRALAAELETAEGASWEDVDRLPYLEAVLKEALRLYPPARHVDRCPVSSMVVDGVRVGAGTNVLVSPLVTHHEPRLWKDASAFRPERWLGDDAATPERGQFIPFGAGAHTCIGEPLARLIVKQVLRVVAPARRVRVVAGSGEPVPGAAPLRVRLEPR